MGAGPLQDVGRVGESAAFDWYAAEGYRLVARNWRCRLGEIDIVLARGGTLVVCEVKTRRGSGFGWPFEAVTAAKRRKLQQLAEAFLAATTLRPDLVRFDVASVTIGAGGRATVHVFEHAF